MTQYRMFSDTALSKFREFAVAAGINQCHPDGAFDARPKYNAQDQAPPVDDLVKLVSGLLAENATLKKRTIAADGVFTPEVTTPPRDDDDDVVEALGRLSDRLGAFLTPDVCEEARGILAQAGERIGELRKALNAYINAEANGTGDEPPDFAGKPRREGGLAKDSLASLLSRIGTDGTLRGDGSLDRLHKNMSRIGHA